MPDVAMADVRLAPPQAFLDGGRAACRDEDPEIFFPGQGADGSEAKRVCRHCVIRAGCRAWALPIQGLAGVWGGLSANDRTRLRNKGLQ